MTAGRLNDRVSRPPSTSRVTLTLSAARSTLPATVGVMAVGEFEFGTSQKETVTIVSGALTVKLPGSNDWKTYRVGEHFIVQANEKFQLKVAEETAYLCTYE